MTEKRSGSLGSRYRNVLHYGTEIEKVPFGG